MRRNNTVFFITGILALAVVPFCADAQQAPQNPAKDTGGETAAVKDSTEYIRPDYEYKSQGKRDPFVSLAPVVDPNSDEKTVKGLFNYEGASLKGIVRTGSDYYALVTDEYGYSFVLRRGYKVFGGYVTDVTEDAIKLHIVKYGRSMNIIFRLEDSKSTMEEQIGPAEMQVKKPGIEVQYSGESQDKEHPTITIEDIALPSLDTKTVDDVWFSGGMTTPDGAENGHDDVQDAFSIIMPPAGASITLPYELNWSDFQGNAVEYSIVFDDSEDFSSPLFMRGGLKQSSLILEDAGGLPKDTKLFWKVTARDGGGAVVMSRQKVMSFMIR